MNPLTDRPRSNSTINNVEREDLPIHGWYRFVLSYPPHLVRDYISEFVLDHDAAVLDPFCGTGTTIVECKKRNISSIGCDAHPFAALVSRVKTNWTLPADLLRELAKKIVLAARKSSKEHGLESLSFEELMHDGLHAGVNGFKLSEEEEKILPTGFLSQRPLVRLLILREEIDIRCKGTPDEIKEFFLLALAHTIANGAGNFAFGPEIYRTKAKPDYDVLGHFAAQSATMVNELEHMQNARLATVPSAVLLDDARSLACLSDQVSAVITSPPYPNEKDYTRTTRVESILLRIVTDKEGLRAVKSNLLRSNTRNVYVSDEDADEVAEIRSIQRVCSEIETRRIKLQKDSGFERLYHKVVAHYFGGMRRHLRALRPKLRRKAKLGYVVGDQFSFLMVQIETAKLLSELAEMEGYKVLGCNLWRERLATKVRNDKAGARSLRVREEVLLLQKP